MFDFSRLVNYRMARRERYPFAPRAPGWIDRPRRCPTTWLKGYDTYVRAWAGLWLYGSDGWVFRWGNGATKGSPTDAPGWCRLP